MKASTPKRPGQGREERSRALRRRLKAELPPAPQAALKAAAAKLREEGAARGGVRRAGRGAVFCFVSFLCKSTYVFKIIVFLGEYLF